MSPRLPDWFLFMLVLGTMGYALRGAGPPIEPEGLQRTPKAIASDQPRKRLFAPSAEMFVNVGKPENSIGSAYALSRDGLWMTARHVVDGCDQISIRAQYGHPIPVKNFTVSAGSDLAILRTQKSLNGLELNLKPRLKNGQAGYHIGYPKGRPGEVSTRLIGRSRLANRGRYQFETDVLAWAETHRTWGLYGSLGGISGGPVLNAKGEVVGTVIAESPRRGRLFSTTPDSMARFLKNLKITPDGTRTAPLNDDSYNKAARQLRRKQNVVQVLCRVYNRA